MNLEHFYIGLIQFIASLYQLYAAYVLMRTDRRDERLSAMTVFFLGAIIFILVIKQ